MTSKLTFVLFPLDSTVTDSDLPFIVTIIPLLPFLQSLEFHEPIQRFQNWIGFPPQEQEMGSTYPVEIFDCSKCPEAILP
jgi:hypothetical protein